MKWTSIRIKTTTQAEDIVISSLYDMGLEGAQIEDGIPLTALEKEQMFVDILPETQEDDGVAYLSFFVEETAAQEIDTILENVKRELEELREFLDIGEGTIEVGETEDLDWINNWKQYFHQFYIDDILVAPSWEEVGPEEAPALILRIDPGTAFGTGMHETTQLCIRGLRKYVTPHTRLLDVGTGSGILSILSLMMGAKSAVGTDLDACAVAAVEDNCRANGIDRERFTLHIGNIITDEKLQEEIGYECYDIVTANILADVLVPLTPVVAKCLAPGGVYITSGIIDEKEEWVAEAIRRAGLEVTDIAYQGEWVKITARKP